MNKNENKIKIAVRKSTLYNAHNWKHQRPRTKRNDCYTHKEVIARND